MAAFTVLTDIQNRVLGLEYHRPSALQDHPAQWRTHPPDQAAALQGVLKEVGIAGALLAYHSERAGGALVKMDGHLRAGVADVPWPVLVLNVSATCFVAFWGEVPVAFSAWMHMPSGTLKNAKREHRTVCLPDFQGVGIGNAVSEYCAALWAGLGYVAISTTSHPAMIRSRAASTVWRIHRQPGTQFHAGAASVKHLTPGGRAWREKGMRRSDAATRITAGFRYVGPALPAAEARHVWEAQS